MNEATKTDLTQTCPQCGNHCPVDALQCGRGRKYFGVEDNGHEHHHDRGGCCGHGRHKGGLSGLLHQCGRYVHHAEAEETELFQALTDEEKASLQAMLEKLAASWRERYGEESFGHGGHHGEAHPHKHGDHGK